MIYGPDNNVYDAVEAVIENGIAAIHGTTTPAVKYANRIIECLKAYPEVSPTIGYSNVANEGYLYYVYDLNKFSLGSRKLEKLIIQIDAMSA